MRVDLEERGETLKVVALVASVLVDDEEVVLVEQANDETFIELAYDLELEKLSLLEVGFDLVLLLLLKLIH